MASHEPTALGQAESNFYINKRSRNNYPEIDPKKE
jgi:hypothetical protein